MKRTTLLLLVSLILITLILITGCNNTNNKNNGVLAKCLSEKGVVMYGTERCPHCIEQKELFGESFKFIIYVNCDYEYSKCSEAGVQFTPTWIVNGEKYVGVQSLEKLAELSGCQI